MSKPNGIVGIRREDVTVWERRVPLTPDHVRELTRRGLRFVVQPSAKRCYTDKAFEEAGAEVNEDLSSAATIIGVKQVPVSALLPEKTYMFFSHTIKGQLDNMPILDACLERNIRLVDYECITEGGKRGGKRLVAFGNFAGNAGMVDFLWGLGQRLLVFGYSTPFLQIAPSYTYRGLAEAKEAVRRAGEEIKRYGLPPALCPFTFVFTGTGRVSKGAMEVFSLLPHQMVAAADLPALCEKTGSSEVAQHLYGCITSAEDFVERIDASQPFNKQEYYEKPELYRPVFHSRVLPYATILVNGIYWERRFPRLVESRHVRELKRRGNQKLLGVCEITCDLEGSVEFLKKFSSIDSPFYVYNVESEQVTDGVRGDGILMIAVDQLPAELAPDASTHFGNQLAPFVEKLAASDGSVPIQQCTDLAPELHGAVICVRGELTPTWVSIQKERVVNERAAAQKAQLERMGRHAHCKVVGIEGHLFDSGFINTALDLLEHKAVSFQVLDWHVGSDIDKTTKVAVQIVAKTAKLLDEAVSELRQLGASFPFRKADVSIVELPHAWKGGAPGQQVAVGSSGANRFTTHEQQPPLRLSPQLALPAKTVLLLGAGFVAPPLVKYLLASGSYGVTICSVLLEEAAKLASLHTSTRAVRLDVSDPADLGQLRALVAAADVVVSLVPATMHVPVAEACLEHGTPLVTASYVSPQMQALHDRAVSRGVVLLNEAGLDPGLDHMSAMDLLHRVKAGPGNTLLGFQSLCGGLPAPEAADNPLGYKFSWSPRGVLLAALNAARYRKDGAVVEVPGEGLLAAAEALRINPALSLECLPNRDSLAYEQAYQLEGVPTLFRGTLRYGGFSAILHACKLLGLLDTTPRDDIPRPATRAAAPKRMPSGGLNASTRRPRADSDLTDPTGLRWPQLMKRLLGLPETTDTAGLRAALKQRVAAIYPGDLPKQRTVADALEWLGLLDDLNLVEPPPAMGAAAASGGVQVLDCFCNLLQGLLQYSQGERDMALMHHIVDFKRGSDGALVRVKSTLCVYGEEQGGSAMSRTVGLTAAVCADLIVRGKIKTPGVVRPLVAEVYQPCLAELAKHRIVFTETEEIIG